MSDAQEPIVPVSVNLEWCKSCGLCIAMCPKKVLEAGEWGKAAVARPQDCIKCQMCEIICPDFAIEVTALRKQANKKEASGDGR